MQNLSEIWKEVAGYEGLYEVSNFGNVRSLPRQAGNVHIKGRILKQFIVGNGYLGVSLSKEGYSKNHSVHRLVAVAFVPNNLGLPQVNHKDEDKHNNHAENLEWITQQGNLEYGTRTERQKQAITKNIGVPVIQIMSDGHTAVAEYGSISSAAKAVGASTGEIFDCLKNRNMCRGFYWCRSDDITERDLIFWKDSGERVSAPKNLEKYRKDTV